MIKIIHGELYSADFSKLNQLVKLYSSCTRFAYNRFYKYFKLHHSNLDFNDEVRQVSKQVYHELTARHVSDAVNEGKALFTRFQGQKVIFGSKKLFYQRKNLKIDHDTFINLRDSHLYARGDKARSGNPNLRIVDKNEVNDYLRITLSSRNYEFYKLFIPTRYQHDLHNLLASKQSYNIRLIKKDSTHYRVIIDYQVPTIPTKINFDNGVIGIDTNTDRIALCNISKEGNYISSHLLIDNRLLYASKNKKKYAMGCLVKQIINYAIQHNKGIVFEDLDFSDNEYKHLETKWNRVKSNFTWRALLNLLSAKCIQYGIQHKAVKPAFTSIIGKYKYQKLYKIPVHQAAAYVIGRRGLGYKERLSIYGYSRRKVRNFILRTLAGKYGRKKLFNWSLWAAVNRYPDVILPGLLGDIDDLEELSDDILRQGSILVHERDPHEHNLSTITGRRELSSLSKTKTRYKGKKDPCHKTGHY